MPNLWELDSNGTLTLNYHRGQTKAWQSTRRFIVMLAGTQGGKTSFEPWWLWREIQCCGAGDYIAATATYDLFKLKFLPTLLEVFEHILGIGRYWIADRVIEIADPKTGRFLANRSNDAMYARIILRSADAKGGLESATAKAAVCDEAGQDTFTLETYEAIRRRLSLSRGRCLFGTTIYNLGWLKAQLYDAWVKGDKSIDIIQFNSIENPTFPKEEYEEAESKLPTWKFDMFYRGVYSRPPGMIYDCFNKDIHTCPAFTLPATWQRYLGLDFGGVNTAAVFIAEEPNSNKLYVYREYHCGEKSAEEHAADLLSGEPMVPYCAGGSKSEGQWRREFRKSGLPVREPDIPDVEVQIDRVYAVLKKKQIVIFEECKGVIGELESYSRKLDANGERTKEIDEKQKYHLLDALRYIISRIRR